MIASTRNLAAALAVVCLPLLFSGCGTETFEAAPPEITGLWNTETTDYSDRAFEITSAQLFLLQGGDTISAHDIEKVRLSHDDLPLYSIEYLGDEDELFTFRFYLSQAQGGTIHFPNQRDLTWHRVRQKDSLSDVDSR